MKRFGVGRFTLGLQHRDLGEQHGPAIHVFGPVKDKQEEILRFDCFNVDPHYHLAWSYEKRPFIPIDSEAPFQWALETLRKDVRELLTAAGAEAMSADELELLRSTLSELQATHEDLP